MRAKTESLTLSVDARVAGVVTGALVLGPALLVVIVRSSVVSAWI